MVQRASSAYVPARRTINGTKDRAEPARTTAITNSSRTSVQLCKYDPGRLGSSEITFWNVRAIVA